MVLPMRRLLLRGLMIAGLLVIAAITGAFVYAPYLPRLLAEGFPAPAWPARGSFAEIAGNANDPLGEPAMTTLSPALQKLFDESGGRALLVYQGGALRIEHYAPGYSRDNAFNSYSMAKSLVGVLTLDAIAHGEMGALDQRLDGIDASPRELLEMTSGIVMENHDITAMSGFAEKDLESAIGNPLGPMARLHMTGIGEVLPLLHADPKARGQFSYQNVNTAILGSLLGHVDERLAQKIWLPSGAAPAHWRRYADGGDTSAYCCLYARARDFLLAGRFVMRNGMHLPDAFYREFMGLDLTDNVLAKGHYGLHVRHDILDRAGEPLQGRFTYFMGTGGQTVYLMPDKDLVVVRFGERPQRLHSTLYEAWRQIAGVN
jgi:CubicO group peptidase (beta-lactamase class C family)